jgi:hypothetical protein
MGTRVPSSPDRRSLSDFPYEKSDRHHLPDDCRASWRYEVSWSADYQKSLTVHQSGDCATALREWTPLAECITRGK